MTTTRDDARALDAADSRPSRRAEFLIPAATCPGEQQVAYFAGNSLGLQPHAVAADLAVHLDAWRDLAVEAHFEGPGWVRLHEQLRGPASRVVGALEHETVAMNTLTVNLHLLLASFYRPTPSRFRILIEDSAFPSDSYAVASHAAFRGFDPADAVVRVRPLPGRETLDTEAVAAEIDRCGDSLAVLMLGGVNYLSGELLDLAAITELGHAAGATVGWDLAHAVGNVPLALHDWDVDFAAWCTYKYLNGGPGSIAGAYVHERHVARTDLARLVGWFANSLDNRFEMLPELTTVASADGWLLSTPPTLSMAPVLTSLRMFDQVGMPALREKSLRLTGFLERELTGSIDPARARILTPADPARRGSQLSVYVTAGDAADVADRMRHRHGVLADVRRPSVIRLAPTAMYGSFEDCWRAVASLDAELAPVSR